MWWIIGGILALIVIGHISSGGTSSDNSKSSRKKYNLPNAE